MPFTDREVFENFSECVDELLESEYLKQVKKGGIGSSVAIMQGIGFVMARSGPNRESVKAALLTIRFFCQNNEQTSIQNMENRVVALLIPQALKERFTQARATFKNYLAKSPPIGFSCWNRSRHKRGHL